MKKSRRKIILTIFSFIAIVSTAFATTMAWIGIFTYANTENFDINLKTVDFKSEYYLTISSSGEPNSFSDSINIDDIRKQVLKNVGKDISRLETSEALSYAYSDFTNHLSPTTTTINADNSFAPFKTLSTEISKQHYDYSQNKYVPVYDDGKYDYISFDIYFTVDTKEGIGDYTEINAPIFLTGFEDAIAGTIGEHMVLDNDFINIDYSSNQFAQYLPYVPLLKSIPINQKIKVNSANAVRIGFEIFEPIPIDSNYDENNKIASSIIYYGGKKNPSYNNGVYDLGGILPSEFNTALQELMNMKSYLSLDIPDEALNRKEFEFSYENSQIWKVATDLSSPHNYLGVHNRIQTKMKLKTYVWFEGWDSDCLLGIQKQNVIFNLAFTADHDDN